MGAIAVLGATGTIGSAVARRLVRHGHRLILVGRNEDRLAALSGELDQPFAAADLSNSQRFEVQLQEVAQTTDGLQGIVNCVGSLLLKPAHSTSDEEFRQVVETNLFTSFSAVRVGARLMREQGGSIVLFASAAAEVGIHNHEAIAAAKAG